MIQGIITEWELMVPFSVVFRQHRTMLEFVWIHVSLPCLPPSYSSGLFCPLLVLSQIQMVLLSWWHLSGWSLGWAELGMGQSDSRVSLATWQCQIPVSVGLCQKRSVYYCHRHWSTCEKEACKCSSIKTKPPWKASWSLREIIRKQISE